MKQEEQYSGRMEVFVEEDHFKELKKKKFMNIFIKMSENGVPHRRP